MGVHPPVAGNTWTGLTCFHNQLADLFGPTLGNGFLLLYGIPHSLPAVRRGLH